MISKNEWIGLGIYAAVIVLLCIVFADWQILIAILGIMGFFGYMRTRHLVHKYEEK
jgi:uncharacterized membrane protein YdbT with pleckstrin-like domain